MKFEDLSIIEPVLKALRKEEYIIPTPVQEKAIPLILKRRDVLGSAQKGTGKTAAFAIPIIQHLYQDLTRNSERPRTRALVITPCRTRTDKDVGDEGSTLLVTYTVQNSRPEPHLLFSQKPLTSCR